MGNTAQQLAFELIRKLVLAWDPDYNRLTPKEAEALAEAEKNFADGEYFTDDEINWN